MASASVEILKEIEGLDFYKPFFDEGIYEDGRELTDERPYLIKVGLEKDAAGSSFVQYQGSVVSCRINAKAGYYDPKQCIRFKIERANCIPKVVSFHLILSSWCFRESSISSSRCSMISLNDTSSWIPSHWCSSRSIRFSWLLIWW